MCLDDELDAFIERLKSCEALEDVRIIKAYPYVLKPTKLKRAVITVSPSEINAQKISLGQKNLFASYVIDADIFVPVELGSPKIWEYIRGILLSQTNSFPSSVYVSRVTAVDKLSCCTVKCSVTYNGALELEKS